ncbi:MAG: M56 family metallopeptidase [Vicinamibacterales bacterium]
MDIELSSRIAANLVDVAVRSTAVALAVAGILWAARVRVSSARHAAWTGVLVTMCVMPFVPRVGLSFDLRVPDPIGRAATMPTPTVPADISASVAASRVDAQPGLTLPADVAAAPIERRTTSTALPLLVSAYAIVAAFLLLRLAIGWFLARRLLSACVPIRLSDGRAVLESPHLASAVTLGIVGPRIVLPPTWRSWPADTLRAIVAHESAHARRRDPLVSLLARINCAIYWFHPLAWWLERTLAALSEEACDDAAATEIGERRRYAEIVLGVANAVRAQGGRVAWQGLGVSGNGRLVRRIARLIDGTPALAFTGTRRIVVSYGCAAALVVGAACGHRSAAPRPLREDPDVARQLAEQAQEEARYKAAQAMTRDRVDALEASLRQKPGDVDTLLQLRTFYQTSGQKVFGWDEMVKRRLPHVLSLIDRYPEFAASVWRISPDADAVGYTEAKSHWMAQAARTDASRAVVRNAAAFLHMKDAAEAERLWLRAARMAPSSESSAMLGTFYGTVLLGPTSPRDGSPLTPLERDEYAREVFTKVLAADDPVMLTEAGMIVNRGDRDAARRALARQLLERALSLDPDQPKARHLLARMDVAERSDARQQAVRAKQAELAGAEIARKLAAREPLTPVEREQFDAREYEAVAALPEHDRLPALARLAVGTYLRAEYYEHTKKDAASLWQLAARSAEEALALAGVRPDHPDYGTAIYDANLTLGALELRAGHRDGAVRHLQAAAKAPPTEALAVQLWGSLDGRLVTYLLQAGERDSVADFLERAATLRTYDRDRLLEDARKIRAGVMPLSYQYAMARSPAQQTR